MSIISSSLGRRRRWSHFKRQLTEWRRRARSRSELQFLSDQILQDIGFTRCDVHRELNKTFWMS